MRRITDGFSMSAISFEPIPAAGTRQDVEPETPLHQLGPEPIRPPPRRQGRQPLEQLQRLEQQPRRPMRPAM
jgi:hypothetical protein